jgi:acyl dehydratase
VDQGVSYQLSFGTYDDALRMVGATSEPRTAATAVSGARIQLFAAMVHDGNRSYWDAEFARQKWGGLLAPPASLMGWLIPPPWEPHQQGRNRPPAASMVLRVPLPGTTFINAANEVEFLAPIVEGDVLTVVEELVSVSPEKRTRLGVGHFVETLETYRRQDETVVATCRNSLFRFTPGPSS